MSNALVLESNKYLIMILLYRFIIVLLYYIGNMHYILQSTLLLDVCGLCGAQTLAERAAKLVKVTYVPIKGGSPILSIKGADKCFLI
jgi:hypothetical protein